MSIHQVNQIKSTTGSDIAIQFSSSGALGLGGANYGTSGQVAVSQGSGSAPTWTTFSILQGIGGGAASGSFTYTPPSTATKFLVYCVGGGGGGGPSSNGVGGAGGGSGGCAWRYYTSAEIGSSASVTVGAGGAGGFWYLGVTPYSGGNGGDSTFDPQPFGSPILTGGGGGGASPNFQANGGFGGTTTNSVIAWNGNPGMSSYGTQNGKGGTSVAYGGGNGGDSNYTGSNSGGVAGSAGVVVIFEFY